MLEAYDRRREALEKELSACVDAKAAADCLGKTLEQVRMEVRGGMEPAGRRETDRLFEAARQAALLMMTVTEADVRVLKETKIKTPKEKLMELLPWASVGAGLILTGWMLAIGESAAAILSVVSAGLGAVQGLVKEKSGAPRLETEATRVNVYELMRLTDRLMQALEDAMAQIGEEERQALPGAQPRVTSELLAPMQMLMEAVYTQDGDYALKAAPQLVNALSGEGVELVDYSEATKAYFDLFPGTEGGLTIRPAVLKDGRLLARGQATEQI